MPGSAAVSPLESLSEFLTGKSAARFEPGDARPMQLSPEQELRAMWAHPDLEEIFQGPSARRPQTLEGVLAELGEYGEATLGQHDERDATGLIAQEYVCSLRWRGEQDFLIGTGENPTVAALRCLMESVSKAKKLIRRGLDEIQFGA